MAATVPIANQWIKVSFDKGYASRGARVYPKVVIVLHITSPAAYTYDPESGVFAPMTTEPQENHNPIGGIRLVVKRNPGGSAERMVGETNGDGIYAFPSSMEVGNYDIVMTMPAHAINLKGTAAANRAMVFNGAAIVLYVAVDSKGNIRVTKNGTLQSADFVY